MHLSRFVVLIGLSIVNSRNNARVKTRVKICGITSIEDMQHAVEAGADAIGLVFYAQSSRAVSITEARAIVRAVPPLVMSVGLFVDPTAALVQEVLMQMPLDMLQFHGAESNTFCKQFKKRFMKAVPMRDLSRAQAADYVAQFPDASGFLFDAFGKNVTGGSGETFAWQAIPTITKPVIIAGGLTPENVQQAVRSYQPYGVDVSSGVESAPGRKSFAKMGRFILNATA